MASHHRQRELNLFGTLLHVAGVLTTLALVSGIALAAVMPVNLLRADHEAQVDRLQRLLASAPRIEGGNHGLKQKLQTVRRRKAELRRRITDGAREGEFLRQVSEAAADVDLKLREFRPGDVSRHGRYATMRVELRCEGSYGSICRFLERLDGLPRLATASRIEITAPLHSTIYPFNMTLEIYFAADGPVANLPETGEGRDV